MLISKRLKRLAVIDSELFDALATIDYYGKEAFALDLTAWEEAWLELERRGLDVEVLTDDDICECWNSLNKGEASQEEIEELVASYYDYIPFKSLLLSNFPSPEQMEQPE